MTEINQIYHCNVCGNIIEVLHNGADSLTCCGQKMELLVPNSTDAANEKHVPVIEKGDGMTVIKIGSVAHPMENEHFIQWIEIITEDGVQRKYLKPGEDPQAVFNSDGNIKARAYCNLHGLWVN